MATGSNVGFYTGSIRGGQKKKLNLRRYIRLLPQHKKLDRWEKLYRKRYWQSKAENDK